MRPRFRFELEVFVHFYDATSFYLQVHATRKVNSLVAVVADIGQIVELFAAKPLIGLVMYLKPHITTFAGYAMRWRNRPKGCPYLRPTRRSQIGPIVRKTERLDLPL
jgi:hypothetical protein